MANIEEKVETLLSKTITDLGYELYDVVYEKEAQDYYLRIFIDSPKGIGLDDCEKVNNEITGLLDEAEYIKEQYFLEVSSTGVERALRKDKHFAQNLGKEITINLFKPIRLQEKKEKEEIEKGKKKKNKKASIKQLDGILESANSEEIVINIEEKQLTISKKDIANVKLKYHWE